MRDPLETLQISDPRFEYEGLRHLTVKSAALGGRGDITVWLPPNHTEEAELPLVLLLHGVYGSHWAWTLNGGAHRTAAPLIAEGRIRPMALVMPSDGLWGEGSGYIRHADRDFERWIVEEVPWAARLLLPETLHARTPLFIAGLSMGGFGALRIGGKFGRTVFDGVSGHSSITEFEQMAQFVEEPLERYGVAPEDRSVLEALLANRDNLPPLRFDCGLSDPLLEANRALHAGLEEAGIPHVYEEFPGGHEWPYWETHLEATLRFFDGVRRETH
jgi:putative tributyrin esterase